MKTPRRSRREFRLSPVEHLETRALLTMATTAQLPDMSLAAGVAPSPADLDAYFKDPGASPDFAVFDTSLGTIPVLLTPSTTPLTVANFLSHVNKGDYTDTVVHRSVPGFIWQSGGYQLSPTSGISAV